MTCDDVPRAVFAIPRSSRRALLLESLVIAILCCAFPAAAEPQTQPILKAPDAASRTDAPKTACISASDCDRRAYDYSGTRGRMGLGASPYHPEGPGNAPN
jgi:hypothetical protein